jgi:hypothetical protein
MRRAAVSRWLGVSVAFWPAALIPGLPGSADVPPFTVTASMWGAVFDSVADRPLAGAVVQLAARDSASQGRVYAARTDSGGRYRLAGVPSGSYMAGFFHPALDALGLESDDKVVVVGSTDVEVNFAIPSARTLHDVMCPQSAGDSSAALFGHVHATDGGTAITGATVSASWLQLDTDAPFLRPRQRRLSAASADEGWFAMCSLPPATSLTIVASAGADSSGFLRMSIAAGTARPIAIAVGGATRWRVTGDSSGQRPGGLVWRGGATARGVVRDSAGRPLPNAEVAVWGTDRNATTGRNGAFALDSLPGGTQTLEVRAVGFDPAEIIVQLAPTRVAEVQATLSRAAVSLPTVNVEGAAARRTAHIARFYERKELAARGINYGYFLTQDDIEKKHLPFFSALLEGLPGIHVLHGINPFSDDIRGPLLVGPMSYCKMTIYLDGIAVANGLSGTPDAINTLVHPGDIAGVEVYPYPVGVPPEYQMLNGTCGVILIWTK